ncbi:ABC transporter substrate-binding protein [Clostridium sp. FS41]|uniref:ABC transporter substrate-binding protein n=1 Tax=Clostridium sp. FS41 TaxID=1609975 RepID=UPI0005D444FA|nr:ABC transporter substrate-binding protein [Clostridium sp. FS41]KJJ75029.1 hypothetical protein CLFS41_08990 [Clostridium sp. FS41]
MKKMKKALSVVLAGALALGLMACSGNSGSATPAPSEEKTSAQQNDVQTESQKESSVADKKSEEGPIIVGFLGWSSGADAMYGLVPQHLLETYFKKVNAEGGWLGREIDFRTYDISGLDGDFSEAVNAANKLIQSGAVAILGPSNSTQGAAVAELCNRARVLHIPSSASQLVTVDDSGSVRPYTYRSGPVNTDQVATMASYTYSELNNPKVAVLYETTQVDTVDMANAYKDTYTKLGGEIVSEATYQINDVEFRAQLTSLSQSEPDYIFMPVMGYKEAGYVAQQLVELGLSDIKLLGNYVYDTEDLLTLAGPALEGCIFATDGDLSDSRFDEIKAEYEDYQQATGMALHMPGLKAFNEAKILEYAILTSGSTNPDEMRKALDETTGFDMITSPNKGYSPETHNLQGLEFTIKTVKDGKFESLGKYAMPAN